MLCFVQKLEAPVREAVNPPVKDRQSEFDQVIKLLWAGPLACSLLLCHSVVACSITFHCKPCGGSTLTLVLWICRCSRATH